MFRTSRDRPKSAPYPRLKKSKRIAKCQFTVLENRKPKNNGPSGAPGHASASPWRAKRGDISEIVNIFVAVEGGTLWRKNIFDEKVSQCRKIVREDLLRFFNIHSGAKHQKLKEWKSFYNGKNLTRPKKTERGALCEFQHPFCRKTAKSLSGDPLRKKTFPKKSLAVPKKNFGLSWYGMLREKTGRTVLVQFARTNRSILCNNIL